MTTTFGSTANNRILRRIPPGRLTLSTEALAQVDIRSRLGRHMAMLKLMGIDHLTGLGTLRVQDAVFASPGLLVDLDPMAWTVARPCLGALRLLLSG